MFRKPPVRLLPTTSLNEPWSWFLSSSGSSKDCHHLHTPSVSLTQSTMLDCLKTFDLCTVLVLLLLVFKLFLPRPLSCPTLGYTSLHVTKVIKTKRFLSPPPPFVFLASTILKKRSNHYTSLKDALPWPWKAKYICNKIFFVFSLSQFQLLSQSYTYRLYNIIEELQLPYSRKLPGWEGANLVVSGLVIYSGKLAGRKNAHLGVG